MPGLLALAFAAGSAAPAHARFGSDHDRADRLSTAAGVAAPSSILGLDSDNPAGLADVGDPRVVGAFVEHGGSGDGLGRVFTGNGRAGVGAGIDTDGAAVVGGAAAIPAIGAAFGLRARYDDGFGGIDLGLTLGSDRTVQLGLAAYGLESGPDSLAAGLALALGPDATFAVDVGTNERLDGATVKPGVRIAAGRAQLMLAYGFDVGSAVASPVGDGVSGGIGFELGSRLLIQYYADHFTHHYLGLRWAL